MGRKKKKTNKRKRETHDDYYVFMEDRIEHQNLDVEFVQNTDGKIDVVKGGSCEPIQAWFQIFDQSTRSTDDNGIAWLQHTTSFDKFPDDFIDKTLSSGILDLACEGDCTKDSTENLCYTKAKDPNQLPEDTFPLCNHALVNQVATLKTKFEAIPPKQFRQCRALSNPFECLGKACFVNRSALKMANLDALCQLLPASSPEEGPDKEGGCTPFRFVDLCGGPGGFSEYLMWKRNRKQCLPIEGWGISLIGENDQGKGCDWRIQMFMPEISVLDHSTDVDFQGISIEKACRVDSETSKDFDGVMLCNQLPTKCLPTTKNGSPDNINGMFTKDNMGNNERTLRVDASSKKQFEMDQPGRPNALKTKCYNSLDILDLPPSSSSSSINLDTGKGLTTLSGKRLPTCKFQVCYGQDGTGNLYHINNVDHFINQVLQGSGNTLMDLVMGDGGFTAARNQYQQEPVIAKLFLSQILVMYNLIKPGGDFVCKLFEAHFPLTVGLLLLLHQSFGSFALVKPIASRPASGECYVVCKSFHLDPKARINVQRKLSELHNNPQSYFEHSGCCLSKANHKFEEVVKTFDTFIQFIKSHNDNMLQLQKYGCSKIILQWHKLMQLYDATSSITQQIKQQKRNVGDEDLIKKYNKLWNLPN